MSSYDIIGDIHGEADALTRLLETLGYTQVDGVYRHPERRALFLGDFIDRGLAQREVLDIVRPMVDHGTALAVMGNHEFNEIAYATPHRDTYLRLHTDNNRHQHGAFLHAFENDEEGYQEAIRWFKKLPMWQAASTYRDAYIGPPLAQSHIPDDPIDGDHLIEYAWDEKPVFIGHYWLTGTPAPLAPNIACVDYSVAKPGGLLAAYRFDGETELSSHKFVSVAP